jgi:hypothetical protein
MADLADQFRRYLVSLREATYSAEDIANNPGLVGLLDVTTLVAHDLGTTLAADPDVATDLNTTYDQVIT